jgi:hypothetical protein
MVRRPDALNGFEFVVAAGLRAAELRRGSTVRVELLPSVVATARHEVANRNALPGRAAAGPFVAPTDC